MADRQIPALESSLEVFSLKLEHFNFASLVICSILESVIVCSVESLHGSNTEMQTFLMSAASAFEKLAVLISSVQIFSGSHLPPPPSPSKLGQSTAQGIGSGH